VNITYLEEKFYKSKASIVETLMERRREDVRDQMIELSSRPTGVAAAAQLSAQLEQQEAVAEAARQRRAAEREGRRRRRLQQRLASQRQLKAKHNDGMSSDDELSTLEQANLSKTRQDIENQARQVLSDVVEDFSTVEGVKEKLESWKTEDAESYGDAYVFLCLPKVFSPLIRLQLLFWNPFAVSYYLCRSHHRC
jgi:GC-rich sequence DNA-binding factor